MYVRCGETDPSRVQRHCAYGKALWLSDLKQAVVYLRDPADSDVVAGFARAPSDLPRIMVYGSVCRPEWLVEMEAVE